MTLKLLHVGKATENCWFFLQKSPKPGGSKSVNKTAIIIIA